MQAEDLELVTRSKNGDLMAFNIIVERHQTLVFNVAVRILGNKGSAEDVTQEAFVSAYRAIGKFREGSLRAWLSRIVSNLSYDLLRSRKRRPEQSLDQSLENPGFQVRSEGDSPEQLAINSELGAEIQRAILNLPEDQRTLLVLIDVQGFSYEEASEATGVSAGTVKSRLSRARARVRDDLMQHRELLPAEFRQ